MTEEASMKPTVGNGKHDVHTHRIIVCGLVLAVLLSGGGVTALAALNRPIPAELAHMGAVALGALAMATSSILGPREPKH